MLNVIPINHKRSSSNLDVQYYEPPMKKSSFTSLPPTEIYEAPKSNVKKVFNRVPMGDFLTKCGLISRGQQVFEDIFINDDIYVPPMPAQRVSASLDNSFAVNYDSNEKKSEFQVKFISSICLETEQNNSCLQKHSQQQLLETRAREESSEFSIIGDEEDQIECHKCTFLTEQLEPSVQIIISGVECAQPIIADAENIEIKENLEILNDEDFAYEGLFDLKVLEFGSCM